VKPLVRAPLAVLIAVLLGTLAIGCTHKVTDSGGSPHYLPRTSPENVVQNLVTAYENRDTEAYADLLAPEFRFYFQERDVPRDLDRDYWIRSEDSGHTGSLFGAREVRDITVHLDYGPATDPTELDKPPGTKKIHLTARVEVDDRYGTAYLADGDFEDLFFRKGLLQNAGEDTTLWYLFEWRDIRNPSRNGAAPGDAGETAGTPAPVQSITWGLIKQLYP
jgi:hypothetical protein